MMEVEHLEAAQCPPHPEVLLLSRFEVEVIAERWPVDVLQELEVVLFFTRCPSDLPALVCSCCGRWMFTVLHR